MDALPYYKWNWQDWRASRRVQRMTYVDRGLYRELLDEQWKVGSLPAMMEDLADICGCPVEVMTDSWNRLRFHFEEEDGRLVNHTLEKMRTVTDSLRVANAKNGKAGAFKKMANATQDEATASDRQPPPDERQTTASDRHIEEERRVEESKEEKRTKAPPLAAFVLPAWIDPNVWKAYEEMRGKIRKPMTNHARALAVTELVKLRSRGHDPTAVLNNSIQNSWQGLFEPKPEGASNGTNRSDNRGQRRVDAQLEALERANALDRQWSREAGEDSGLAVRVCDSAEGADGRGGAGRVLEGAV